MRGRQTITRRDLFHQAGTGLLGLSLGGLLRARSEPTAVAGPSRIRACILVFQYGGPSHLDTFDLKPDAPAEVRGEFKPVRTTVPGLHVCEHLPRLAGLMHKVALVRSLHHTNRLHDSASIETLTGRPSPNGDREEFAPIEQFFPCHGATLGYLWRGRGLAVPHAALPFAFRNVIEVPCQGGGFLGSAFDPLQIDVDPASRTYRVGALDLPPDLTGGRLHGRRTLLGELEGEPPALPAPAVRQIRGAYERAYRLLDSEALRKALDLSREPARVRERYGYDAGPKAVGEGGGGGNGGELGLARAMRGQNFLLARRLVEAGVPFVNVYDFRQQGRNWDAHFKVASQHKNYLLPMADRGLSALLEDLDARGLLESTLVVVVGEFGRTPRINKDAGRDHWPDCYSALLAGGGVRGGTVYGSSDKIGAFPDTNPVTPGDLVATLFWRFGIDPSAEVHDQTGRPHPIARGTPIRDLFAGEG